MGRSLPGAGKAMPPPHIVLVLADDIGHNGVGRRNPSLSTPALDRLGEEGVFLEDFYSAPTCSPARASLMTSRWAFKSIARNNAQFWIEEGLHEGYALLPEALARRGYVTSMVGKWHLGHYRPSLLPTSRGFASYFGFLSGCEDHRTQENCCACPNRAVVDLFRNGLPARGENGTDNTEAFTREACEVVRRYASRYDEKAQTRRPLFLYLALQDVHAPFQVNPRFEALHQSPLRHFNVWAGMVSAVDETVHNVTQELKRSKMWSRTLFVFMSDNGSPVDCTMVWCAGSNAPLRGGKNTLWEGGVRAPALVSGGWVPRRQHGKLLRGLCHIVDWFATFCALSGGPCAELDFGPSIADGVDLSSWLHGDILSSPRNHVVLGHTQVTPYPVFGLGQPSRAKTSMLTSVLNYTGALRVGNWKLILGDQPSIGWYGEFAPNSSSVPYSQHKAVCQPTPCLFDVANDPTEQHDLAAIETDKLSELLQRFQSLQSTFHAPRQRTSSRHEYCAAAAASGGYMVPWRS